MLVGRVTSNGDWFFRSARKSVRRAVGNSSIATMGSSMGGQAGSIGLGFAIPINTAKRIAEELISTVRMERDLYWTPKPLSQC